MNAQESFIGIPFRIPETARILIVSNDYSDAEQLKAVLLQAGFVSECATSITDGCEAARSGKYQVVVSAPLLRDGSWRRLTDIANHYDLCFEVVLWTHDFDVSASGNALNDGAFDVLDAVHEQQKIVEVAKGALWAAYLRGAPSRPVSLGPRKVA